MPNEEGRSQFYRPEEKFNPLEELYVQYVRADPSGPYDMDIIMTKMINIGFPILGWGEPPQMMGGMAFFHREMPFLPKGKTSEKLNVIFQKVLAELFNQNLLQTNYR